MPRNKDEEKKTVWPNRSFYFRTRLSNERMAEISDWVGTLTKEQKEMLDDICTDEQDESAFSNNDGV